VNNRRDGSGRLLRESVETDLWRWKPHGGRGMSDRQHASTVWSRKSPANEPTGQTLEAPKRGLALVAGNRWRDCRSDGLFTFVYIPSDRRRWERTLKGKQSPWKDRVSAPGNGGRHYGLVGGARPWSRLLRIAATRRLRPGQHLDLGGTTGSKAGEGFGQTEQTLKDTDTAKPGDRLRRKLRHGRSSAVVGSRELAAALMMNPGLVHSSDVWHSLRRVAGIMATARRNPVSSSEEANPTRRREGGQSGGTGAGFGQRLDAGAVMTTHSRVGTGHSADTLSQSLADFSTASAWRVRAGVAVGFGQLGNTRQCAWDVGRIAASVAVGNTLHGLCSSECWQRGAAGLAQSPRRQERSAGVSVCLVEKGARLVWRMQRGLRLTG